MLYVFAVATPRQRVLPVIDLASKQEDSLGWQLREMNHLVLPRVKNAVLEAALAATQVRQKVSHFFVGTPGLRLGTVAIDSAQLCSMFQRLAKIAQLVVLWLRPYRRCGVAVRRTF